MTLLPSAHNRCRLRALLFAGLASVMVAPLAVAQPGPPIYPHPDPATGRSFFTLAQAYRVVARGNPRFAGERQQRKVFGAVEGILELATRPVAGTQPPGVALDAAAFATCRPPEESSPVVVAVELRKQIPGSALFPTVYQPATFTQSGAGSIRTHWALVYTQPGTTFTLDVTVRCTSSSTGALVEHIDRYVWQVVATLDSVRALIDALHTHALGTSEVPLVASEAAYTALHAGVDQIDARVRQGDRTGARAAIASLQTQIQTLVAAGGIFTTTENPSAEALGVALEYIADQL